MKGPRDDQPEIVDIDRLLVKIVRTHRDGPRCAFAGAVAGGDDHFRVGFEAKDLGEGGEALVGAVGVGRQAEIERNDGRLVRA